MKTSVDFLIEKLIKEKFISNELTQTYTGGLRLKSLIDSAKLMEKEQIIESFKDGGGISGDDYYDQKWNNIDI